MSFLPDEVQIDDSIDTKRMAPEDDFASPADPRIPRKGPAQEDIGGEVTDSYYGEASRDLDAPAFDQQQLPNAFARPPEDRYAKTPKPEYEIVGDDDDPELDLIGGNQPAVEPGQDEGDVDQDIDNEYPEELLAAAGLTLEQAQEFGSVQAVQSAVRYLDTQFVSQGNKALESAPAAQPLEDIVVEEDNWELPEPVESSEWDEDTKRLATSMVDKFKGMLSKRDRQLKEQQEFIQQYVQEQQREKQRQSLDEFDGMVNSLPDEWVPLLGRGTAFDLDPNSLAFNNRVHLDRTMIALQQGNLAAGRPPIQRDELMIRSLGVAFPDVQRQVIRNEVIEEVGQRQRLMTSRPTQRRQPAMTPVQKAAQTAKEWYRQHNLGNEDTDDENFEL